jgi:RNA polymerase sigma-70 factor (ECF subfamily)
MGPHSGEPTTEVEQALLETFTAVRGQLLGRLRSMLGNYEDAQDALQTGFLRCWQARDRLSLLGNLRAWVWRVTLNAGRDLLDRLRIRRAQPLEAVLETACSLQASPEEALLTEERLERFRAALGRLRSDEKEVFLLRQEEELTFQDIARLRGRPVGTGKSLMRSARRKLQDLLDDEALSV